MINFTQKARLTRDVESRQVGDHTVYNFGVAYDKGFGDKARPCFLEVTAWNKKGEIISGFFKKGSEIIVQGDIEMDSWTDSESGKKMSKHFLSLVDFEFCGPKGGEEKEDLPF